MKKLVVLFLTIFTIVSCKSKAVLIESNATSTIDSDKIIKSHYNNTFDFTTLYIRASAKYEDSKNTQRVTTDIRIKKDEKILISVKVLGLTMAKALITPNSVQYFEKIGNKYFEGDYATLSQWIGTDLDFNKVQNLLLGQSLDNLNNAKYTVTINDKLYKLNNKNESNTQKTYFFEAENFLLKKQEFYQPSQNRTLQITYPEFQKIANKIVPLNFSIEAQQQKGKTNIDIEYKNITFNEDLSFPYSVPEGYERIFIE